MQDVHDSKDDSKKFLKWCAVDETQDAGLDLAQITEDAIQRKRRLQGELSKALAVLGVKHSTFQSLLNKGRHSEVRKLLKTSMNERLEFLKKSDPENVAELIKEDFNIHLEFADATTIHESYQFLVKKYVDDKEDTTSGSFLDLDQLRERNQRRKSKTNLLGEGQNDPKKQDERYLQVVTSIF